MQALTYLRDLDLRTNLDLDLRSIVKLDLSRSPIPTRFVTSWRENYDALRIVSIMFGSKVISEKPCR